MKANEVVKTLLTLRRIQLDATQGQMADLIESVAHQEGFDFNLGQTGESRIESTGSMEPSRILAVSAAVGLKDPFLFPMLVIWGNREIPDIKPPTLKEMKATSAAGPWGDIKWRGLTQAREWMGDHLKALQAAAGESGLPDFDLESLPEVARAHSARAISRVTGQVAGLTATLEKLKAEYLDTAVPAGSRSS